MNPAIQTRTPGHKRLSPGQSGSQTCAPQKYLAPSWSWAGRSGGRVSFGPESQYEAVTPFAKILDIDIQLVHQDPFGAVSGGSITLHGPLLRLNTIDSPKAPQSLSAYPNLMAEIAPLLQSPVANSRNKNAGTQRVGLFMLLKWCEKSEDVDRMCFLILLEVIGEDSWTRLDLLVLKCAGLDRKEVDKAMAILKEIKGKMQKERVRII
jgi:hypothetical protein